MLPLQILKAAENSEIMIELKNGETFNGNLAKCDPYMNIKMTDIICTSQDGEEFHKLKECYIRGNNIKYLRMGDAILKKSEQEYMKQCIGMRGKRGRRGFPFRGGNIQNIVSQISKAEELEEDTKNHKFSIKGCMNV